MAMIPGLEAAVRDGVIDASTAHRLEPYIRDGGARADGADPDDEKLRLVTGFNDIFVTIGIAMFLGALGYLLWNSGTMAASLAVAAGAWGLAEFFTRVRRQALPSIVLLVVFVGAVFLAVLGAMNGSLSNITPEQMLAAGLAASLAALLHWWRFHVPITVAAGTAAVAAILLSLCSMAAPGVIKDHPIAVFLPVGLAIFALAMWFDSSDLKRQTRRTDIAFWLHLLAAPIIVHPILLSVTGGSAGASGAALVIAVFVVLAVVALVVDRRAILGSSLTDPAYAAGTLIAAAGIEAPSLAVSTLAVGAVVLTLSAAWRPLRRAFMGLLPQDLRARLPAVA